LGKNLEQIVPVSASVGLSLEQWHQRYLQQARWTQDIRQNLFNQTRTTIGSRILEIGSGTGALLQSLAQEGYEHLTGIDINRPGLRYSQEINPLFTLAQADGYDLPFADKTFAVTCCHYLLLWIEKPAQILAEMSRVTHSGGCVIALAEPDHQARIDHPSPLDKLGTYQIQALQAQGADTAMGRKLGQQFHEAGLQSIKTGIIGARWSNMSSRKPDETEWMTLRADLTGFITEEELRKFEALEKKAWDAGERVLFVPTFFAIGFVG